MKNISVRYGGRVPLSIETDDVDALTAVLYVGKPGHTAVITKIGSITTVDGVRTADLSLDGGEDGDTNVPLGEYNYQINLTYASGGPEKFPEPGTCEEDDLPTFTVLEALDEIEVS